MFQFLIFFFSLVVFTNATNFPLLSEHEITKSLLESAESRFSSNRQPKLVLFGDSSLGKNFWIEKDSQLERSIQALTGQEKYNLDMASIDLFMIEGTSIADLLIDQRKIWNYATYGAELKSFNRGNLLEYTIHGPVACGKKD